MRFTSRRAEGRNGVGESPLSQRHHIHIPFNHEQTINAAQRLTGLIETIQLLIFGKHRRLWRVEVLGAFLVAELASSKANHTAPDVANGEHDAVPKAVVNSAAVVFDCQPRLKHDIGANAFLLQHLA